MRRRYWLVKQEPQAYAWETFFTEKGTAWTGVRNYQARNNLRDMQAGDYVAFYHSVSDKAVVGIAQVAKTAYPDPTADQGDWSCVDLTPLRALQEPVSLEQIKADPQLKKISLVRQSRLSVLPLTATEFRRLLALGKTKLP